jgi:diacylglycerol kinase family enzyme
MAMPDRVLIFANPVAGRGRGTVVARRIESDLRSAGFDPVVSFDRLTGPVGPDVSAVVTVGGDGTLREVVDHLYADAPPGRTVDGPPILPVSMGTANLMGRHLGYRWTPATLGPMLVRTLQRRQTVRLDAGRANGKLFLLMAGVGIDGAVVHELARTRKGPIAMASYLLPTAVSFAQYRFEPITVVVDGETVLEAEPAIAVIGNVREYGTGLPIVPDADPSDGLLDVCVMPCDSWTGLMELILAIASQTHTHRDGVVNVRGRSVRVTANRPVPVQIDGDAAGFTPLNVETLAGLVPFLIPG